MILKKSIEKLMRGEDLTSQICQQVIEALLDPTSNPLQLAAFLVLLKAKPETTEEITGLVKALRQKMRVVPTLHPVLDIVGTGGDGMNTVNISTGSALLAASCGIKVAKHGNRAVSSLAGSADVIEALGINLHLSPEHIGACIDEVGIGFCYAPNFHPFTQHLRALRKSLDVPTIFNLLGPLLNPAMAQHYVMGVADHTALDRMADVLLLLGCQHSVIVSGGRIDEISTAGITKIIELKDQQKIAWLLDPRDFGFSYCSLADLRGADAKTNARMLEESFAGKPGPVADTLILNTALALYVYGSQPDIHHAIIQARDTLASGAVMYLLKQWREFSYDQQTRCHHSTKTA